MKTRSCPAHWALVRGFPKEEPLVDRSLQKEGLVPREPCYCCPVGPTLGRALGASVQGRDASGEPLAHSTRTHKPLSPR